MSLERQSPDAIVSSSGLTVTGGVAYIQDDPDSPDANWLTAVDNNTDGQLEVSFGNPSGTLTVGADLQEFRVLVQQFDTGQSGTPTARIELWESGGLIRAGTDTNVPASDTVLSFTWNANELADGSGAGVECNVVTTHASGSPSSRNSVNIGAVEWNDDYVAPGLQEGTASVSGLASTVATIAAIFAASASALGIGSTSASASLLHGADTSISATSSVVVSASRLRGADTSIAGTSSASSTGYALRGGLASILGTAAVTASSQITGAIEASASVAGVGSLSASGTAVRSASASISGLASMSASGYRLRYLQASASGTASVAPSAVVSRSGSASISGAASLSATGSASTSGSTASASGTATVSASIDWIDGRDLVSGKYTAVHNSVYQTLGKYMVPA